MTRRRSDSGPLGELTSLAIVGLVDAIQEALGERVVAIVLCDSEGQLGLIPCPGEELEVIDAIASANFETMRHVAEEWIP